MQQGNSLRLQRVLLILVDAMLLNLTVWVAFLIRFEGTLRPFINGAFHPEYFQEYLFIAPWLTVLMLVVLDRFGLHRTLWRYAGMYEVQTITIAATVRSLLFWLMLYLRSRSVGFLEFPRSVIILTWLLDIIVLGGSRLSVRLASRWVWGTAMSADANGWPVRAVLIGAGDTGARVLREIQSRRELGIRVVALVDDDPKKVGLAMGGLPVLGTRRQLPTILSDYQVAMVIVAIPSAPAQLLREIVDVAHECHARIKILPQLFGKQSAAVSVRQLRDVQLEDLLGREPVQLALGELGEQLSESVVMVAGAGGSIGSELCRQLARFSPQRLVLLGRGEYSLYEIQSELARDFPQLPVQVCVADIRNRARLRRVMASARPNLVFHAAAHKRVEMMEVEPEEAIDNNVFGTKTLAEVAIEFGVSRFVLISTDKSVNPTSVYGATKQLAERVVQSLAGKGTCFVVVRYGNVLGSRGSVVPLFRKQIAGGGPVTVTHPDMVRYFMTIPEAAQLVIQAGFLGSGGEVFVLDMGTPVRIMDLAVTLIRLSGLDPERDIAVAITGPRPGERLSEELLTDKEGVTATRHSRIFVARSEPLEAQRFARQLASLQAMLAIAPRQAIVEKLQEMLNTYHPEAALAEAPEVQ